MPNHKDNHPSKNGGLVIEGSEFDLEMKKVIAGEKDDVDWTHYELVNGTWAYSAHPVEHKNSKRGYTDWGTICLYADNPSCVGGRYYCWHALDDGECFSVYNDQHNVNYGFISFYRKFTNVNFWTCFSDGHWDCARSDQKWDDGVGSRCYFTGKRYSGMFKWHG